MVDGKLPKVPIGERIAARTPDLRESPGRERKEGVEAGRSKLKVVEARDDVILTRREGVIFGVVSGRLRASKFSPRKNCTGSLTPVFNSLNVAAGGLERLLPTSSMSTSWPFSRADSVKWTPLAPDPTTTTRSTVRTLCRDDGRPIAGSGAALREGVWQGPNATHSPQLWRSSWRRSTGESLRP